MKSWHFILNMKESLLRDLSRKIAWPNVFTYVLIYHFLNPLGTIQSMEDGVKNGIRETG